MNEPPMYYTEKLRTQGSLSGHNAFAYIHRLNTVTGSRERRLDEFIDWMLAKTSPKRFAAQKLEADNYCGNQKDGRHMLPDDARADAKYCDEACRQMAYRARQAAKTA